MAGSTVTEPLMQRPVTTSSGDMGVIRSWRSQPRPLSSATLDPVDTAEPRAPYAAMPIMAAREAALSSSEPETPRLVKSRYIMTGMPTPKITNPASRRVRRISSET